MSTIEDYALIGDLHTAALVSTSGSIDWLCLPDFDSPACFAALLDSEGSGRWLLAPAGGGKCTARRYLPGTLILETRWDCPEGSVRIVDFMPVRDRAADMVRIVEGLKGTVAMRGELCPRFDYGSILPWISHHKDTQSPEGGPVVSAVAGPDALYLGTKAPLEVIHGRVVSDFTVRAGDCAAFVLHWAQAHDRGPVTADPHEALTRTSTFWQEWAGRFSGAGRYQDAVERSLITLKALTFAPTGGIVAAPTTSLPQVLGGTQNWDYRLCWLRDASMTLQALMAAGYIQEALDWRDWLLRAAAGDPSKLQLVYGIHGRGRMPGETMPWLAGYAGSSPVRAGLHEGPGLQLDVWGEVLDGLALIRAAAPSEATEAAWDIQVALMEHLEGAWREPDNGLWNLGPERRHHVHSKVMAWVAADRMVTAVRRYGQPGPGARWAKLRRQIHAEVMAHGFNEDMNSFVQSYGSTELDASLLVIPRVGFLPYRHPRVRGTVDAIKDHLLVDGLLRRYEGSAEGDMEGGGLVVGCSFWLAEALLGLGQDLEATRLFDRILQLRNDVGLLSEGWDPVHHRHTGNTPHAFSHLALVHCALALHGGRPGRSTAPFRS